MNNAAKSKANEQKRLPYRRIYTAFYRSDWPWHLLLLVVLGVTMALFTGLAIMVRQLADLAFAGAPFAELLREGIFVALALVGIAILGGVQRTLLRYVLRTRLLNRLQPTLLECALTFPLDHFTKRSPGDLLAVISNIASSAADGVTMMVEPLFTLLQALFLVMVMAFISLPLTAGVLGLLLLYYGVIQWFRRRQGQLFGRVMASRRVLTGIAGDAHRGFNEIKQNALEETFSRHFSTASRIHWSDFGSWFKNLLVATATADFVNTLLPGVVLFIAALPALAGGMDGAMLVTLYTLAVMLGRLLQALNEMGVSSAAGLRAWAEVMEMMDERVSDNSVEQEQDINLSPALNGKRVAFVGGWSRLCRTTSKWWNTWVAHFPSLFGNYTGGNREIEKLVDKVDVVFCSVDFNSHHACRCVKKACKLTGKPCCFLRSSSLSTFRRELAGFAGKVNGGSD